MRPNLLDFTPDGHAIIERYRKRLEFLLKFQPNGVMGAMYFNKKGIPFHLS